MAINNCPECGGKRRIVGEKPCEYCSGLREFDDMKAIELLILNYGWIDGEHHKQWILDQILRLATAEAYKETIADNFSEWDEGIAP